MLFSSISLISSILCLLLLFLLSAVVVRAPCQSSFGSQICAVRPWLRGHRFSTLHVIYTFTHTQDFNARLRGHRWYSPQSISTLHGFVMLHRMLTPFLFPYVSIAFQDVTTALSDSSDSSDSVPRDPHFAASSHRRQHTSIVSALASPGTGQMAATLLGSARILAPWSGQTCCAADEFRTNLLPMKLWITAVIVKFANFGRHDHRHSKTS